MQAPLVRDADEGVAEEAPEGAEGEEERTLDEIIDAYARS